MVDLPPRRRGHPAPRSAGTPPEPRPEFRTEWVLVPLALLGMAYLLHHIRPAVTWKYVMVLLNIHNTERYTMLFHLCLVLTFVVVAVRLFGAQGKK